MGKVDKVLLNIFTKGSKLHNIPLHFKKKCPQDILSAKQQIQQQMAASRRLSIEREKSAEKLLYQPGSYPNCETNNNPQIYENIDSYIAGEAC